MFPQTFGAYTSCKPLRDALRLFAHACGGSSGGEMPIKSHYNPTVFDRKTVFMQRLADFVRLGYVYYAVGEVRVERAMPLASKFRRLYEVHLHRNQRAKNRADGEASAYCLWWRSHADTVVFALLLTPGPHAARQLERLKDGSAREDRLILGDYELVQRPREGQARPAWTWRLTEDAYLGWRARVLEVVRGGNDFVVGQVVDDLMATPGFAGVREQVKKLKALFRSEWKRPRAPSHPPRLRTRATSTRRASTAGMDMAVYRGRLPRVACTGAGGGPRRQRFHGSATC